MKISLRILPLAISGILLLHAINDFFRFQLNFEAFANSSYVWPSLMPEFYALDFEKHFPTYVLHFLTLGLFVLGIVNFFNAFRLNGMSYRFISISMIAIFILRPVVWLFLKLTSQEDSIYYFLGFSDFILPVSRQLLIGFPTESFQGIPVRFEDYVGSYFSGVVVLILLITTVLIAFKYHFDPSVDASAKAAKEARVQSALQLRQEQYQAHVAAVQASQQAQAQFYQNQINAQQVNSTASSVSEEIANLQRLHESGALTEDEFIAAKKRVIG